MPERLHPENSNQSEARKLTIFRRLAIFSILFLGSAAIAVSLIDLENQETSTPSSPEATKNAERDLFCYDPNTTNLPIETPSNFQNFESGIAIGDSININTFSSIADRLFQAALDEHKLPILAQSGALNFYKGEDIDNNQETPCNIPGVTILALTDRMVAYGPDMPPTAFYPTTMEVEPGTENNPQLYWSKPEPHQLTEQELAQTIKEAITIYNDPRPANITTVRIRIWTVPPIPTPTKIPFY